MRRLKELVPGEEVEEANAGVRRVKEIVPGAEVEGDILWQGG